MKKTPLNKRFVLLTNRTTAHGAKDCNQFMYRSYQLSTLVNMDMFTTATVSLGSINSQNFNKLYFGH